MSDIDELKKLKEEIESAKAERSKAEGRVEQLFNTLKKEYGLKSLEEAAKHLRKLKSEIEGLQKKFDSKFTKLRKDYEW